MIPTRDKLKDIATMRSGTLSEVPYAHLVLALAVERQSAVLEMKRTPLEKQIVFDEGAPVECLSNVATETLGRFMVSLEKLSETDYHSILNASIGRGVPFEDVLAERSIVNPTELYRLLQQNLARKLLDGFSWSAGTFRISHDVPPVESPLRVKASQLLVTGIAKFASQSDVDEAISSLGTKRLTLNTQPFFPLDEVRLTNEQQALTRELAAGMTSEALLRASAHPAEEFNRLLYPLLLLRMVVPEDELPKTVVAPPASLPAIAGEPPKSVFAVPFLIAEPGAAFEDESAPAPAEETTSHDDLIRVYISFRRKDAFDLFELGEDASAEEIGRAWLAFAKRFAPWRFDAAAPDALREKAQDLFLAGSRAYAELADLGRRGALAAKRRAAREAPEPVEAAKPAALAAAPALLDPEAQHRLGRQLAEAGRHREALSHFQFAAECDAQNGVYQSEVIFCKFQLMATTASQALSALKEVMRIDPKCGLAWFYAGKVHAALGNTMEADAYIDRGRNMMNLAKRGRR